MIKNQPVGIKIAKQASKGAPKDGCARDRNPVKENPHCPYTNPSKPSKEMRGIPPITKKLGG